MDSFFQPAPGVRTTPWSTADAKKAHEKKDAKNKEAAKAKTAKAKADMEIAKGAMTRLLKGEANVQPQLRQTVNSLVQQEAIHFLECHGPPWWGDSEFEHVETIKELCCKGAEQKSRCFRGRKKAFRTGNPEIDTPRWGTTDIVSLGHLLRSGIWSPLNGPTNPLARQALINEVNSRATVLEKERAFASRKAGDVVKEEKHTPQTNVSIVLNAEQRKEREKKRDQECGQIESTQADLDRLEALGMHPELVANTISLGDFSSSMESLGPTVGISAAARIIRVMHFQRTRVRTEHPKLHFEPQKLEPLYIASDQRVANELIRFVQDPGLRERQMQKDIEARKKAKDRREFEQQMEVLGLRNGTQK